MAFQLQYKDDSPDIIADRARMGTEVRESFFDLYSEDLKEASKVLALAFAGERRVFLCGTGSCYAVAALLQGRFINPPQAARTAREQGMFTLGVSGGDGGRLADGDLLDIELRVPSIEESLVLEMQTAIACLLSEVTDYYLYTKPEILKEILDRGVSGPQDENAGE